MPALSSGSSAPTGRPTSLAVALPTSASTHALLATGSSAVQCCQEPVCRRLADGGGAAVGTDCGARGGWAALDGAVNPERAAAASP